MFKSGRSYRTESPSVAFLLVKLKSRPDDKEQKGSALVLAHHCGETEPEIRV
jgi:hypothetical protein